MGEGASVVPGTVFALDADGHARAAGKLPKRRRRKKSQPGHFWNLGIAPPTAKHAPDAESHSEDGRVAVAAAANVRLSRKKADMKEKKSDKSTAFSFHSPDDSHARDEAKLTPEQTTAPACSSDFTPPAPECSLYTPAVSSPRSESDRKDGSFTWFCPQCERLNDTQENGSMCLICHWPVELDPSVRSQTRPPYEGCEDACANAREPDPLLRTHTRFTRKDYEDAMAPAGSHVHKRWLDRDPYPDCDSDEPFFYDYDSEGGYVEYGFGEG